MLQVGPAGAFEQEYTVLRNSLFNNALSDDTGTVKITYINLVVRSKAILGLKSTRKLISEINVQLLDRPQVFLLGKTVGSCTDAPAGPWYAAPPRLLYNASVSKGVSRLSEDMGVYALIIRAGIRDFLFEDTGICNCVSM